MDAKLNALIVEDNPATAEALAEMLAMMGITARICETAPAAVAALRVGLPDFMTLDMNMPGVNGIEVLRFIRRDPHTHQMPIIVISSEDQDEIVGKVMNAGANVFLPKPVTYDQLEVGISRAFLVDPDDNAGSGNLTSMGKPPDTESPGN